MCSAPSPLSRFFSPTIIMSTAADEYPVPPGIAVKITPNLWKRLLSSVGRLRFLFNFESTHRNSAGSEGRPRLGRTIVSGLISRVGEQAFYDNLRRAPHRPLQSHHVPNSREPAADRNIENLMFRRISGFFWPLFGYRVTLNVVQEGAFMRSTDVRTARPSGPPPAPLRSATPLAGPRLSFRRAP